MNASQGAHAFQVGGTVKKRARLSGIPLLWSLAHHWAPAVAAFLLSAGALFGGFNSLLGQATSYIVNATLVVFLLFVYRPTLKFWRQVAPVLILCAAAALWVWLVHRGIRVVPGVAPPVAFARDLFAPEMMGFFSGLLALVAGILVTQYPGNMAHFVRWLVIFNLTWMLWGLLLKATNIGQSFEIWSVVRQGRFTGTIGNANVTAALAGAMALLSAGMIFGYLKPGRKRRPVHLTIAVAAFLIFMGALVATASRFSAVIVVLLLLLLVSVALHNRTQGRINAALMRRVFMALVGGGLILALIAGSILMDRLSNMGGDLGDRLTMWGHYAELALNSPFYGYGVGAFPSLNAHFLSGVEMAQAMWSVNSAHNIVLQLLLNGGMPYCGLLIAATIYVGWIVIRDMRKQGWRLGQFAPLLALVQILACAMVDICLDVPAMVILFLALAGALWGRVLRNAQPLLLESGATLRR